MPSSNDGPVRIRPLAEVDRSAVSEIVGGVGNFSPAEIECALEIVGIYLQDKRQKDYFLVVAVDSNDTVRGYACWGPTPLTRGTYDLYWIATHPKAQRLGIGRALIAHVESRVQEEQGRLLVVETSSKESYGNTLQFYRTLEYEEASRIRDFYDAGDDKLVFVKRFPQ